MIYLVTAVSRPWNLRRIHRSIEASLSKSSLKATWILVVDSQASVPEETEASVNSGKVEVVKVVYPGGSCPPYGIEQKNFAMGLIEDGYYHCIDDDNIVHPHFFEGIERAMEANPGKKAFVFGQHRWDNIGPLVAAPNRMEYGKIDNTMFVVHSTLIGPRRYDLDRSGREDFLFFRKLYDVHQAEFVFIPQTLAYYNYIQHFPVETTNEPVKKVQPMEPRIAAPASAETAQQRPQAAGVLKIALYSSNRERCGISTYTEHLGNALASIGHDVRHWGSAPPHQKAFAEILSWRPDIFHVQHETSIMPPDDLLVAQVKALKEVGCRSFITIHTESESTVHLGRRISEIGSGKAISHRPNPKYPEVEVVTMPCTSMGMLPDRASLRRKFGLPEGAFVLSTVGFMIPWKEHPRICELLVPWLKVRRDIYVQVIASEHFNKDMISYSQLCSAGIAKASNLVDGRIRHISGYPSDAELVERLAASDLGYVWCPFDTGSSSAAAAQFVTARCPLVATDSSHYQYLGAGILRGPKKSMEGFVDLIRDVAGNAEVLERLRAAQWSEYRERNYIEAARKHLDLYGGGN